MTLELLIRDQTLYRLDKCNVVGGSINYLFAHITFPHDWVGTRVATFTLVSDAGTSDPISYTLDDNDCCPVPTDLIHAGALRISVCCIDSDSNKRIPSNIISIVIPSDGDADVHGIIPPTPTPQFYDDVCTKLEATQQSLSELNNNLDKKLDKAGGRVDGMLYTMGISNFGTILTGGDNGNIVINPNSGTISGLFGTPINGDDVVSKAYVDTKIGSIDTALDSIITLQEGLL